MAVRTATKYKVSEKLVQNRALGSFAVVGGLYGLLMLRLLFVQGVQGGRLSEEAVNARRHTVVLPAHRGSILDRNLRTLAVSRYTGAIGFDPLVLVDASADPKNRTLFESRLKTALEKGAPLVGMTPDELRERLLAGRDRYRTELAILQSKHADLPETDATRKADRKRLDRFVVLRENVSFDLAQRVRGAGLMSIGVQDDATRLYPAGRDAAQVVGLYSGEQNTTYNGLERSQAQWLNGTPGRATAEMDKNGRPLPETRQVMQEAREGANVVTTIDSEIQHTVSQEAAEIFRKYHPNSVSILVIEPQTGDILAMSGMPDYNPDTFLQDMDYRNANLSSLASPCLSHLFEPGSTMKALTIAIALDKGAITPESYFDCPGIITVDKRKLRCDTHGGTGVHGSLNYEGILRQSCNIGSAKIGMKMGASTLYRGLEDFGLFSKLDVQMPVFPRGRIAMYRPADPRELTRPGRIARVAFGHSIGVTPLHVAMAYAALANGGKLMQPRLVSEIRDADGKTLRTIPSKLVRQAVKPETAAIVERGLRAVVTSGTGKVAAVRGFTVAGKTGTAKLYKANEYVGSFAGFLPASPNVAPRAVIYVMVDRPQGAYYGADVAAPAFQHIAARLMPHLRVPEDDPQSVQFNTASAKRHLMAMGR